VNSTYGSVPSIKLLDFISSRTSISRPLVVVDTFLQAGKETTVNADYKGMKFYEAAVVETNSDILPERTRAAQKAAGQRVMGIAIDEDQQRAIVRTLNALAVLKRKRQPTCLCQ
jgi:hypothetical protein